MTTGWETKPLGEVCDIRNGLWKGKKEPFVQAGVIRNTNFSKDGSIDSSNIAYLDVESRQLEKRRLADGDIVLEKSGGGPKQAVGRVAYFEGLEGEFSFSNFTSAIRVLDAGVLDSRFLHRFLYWMYVSGITERMQSHSTGIRNLNLSAYKQIEVPLPPLEEQKRIVAILDAAFADIDSAEAGVLDASKDVGDMFDSFLAYLLKASGEWQQRTLNDVALDFGRGRSRHRPRNDKALYGGNYPFIQTGDIRAARHVLSSASESYNEVGLAQSKLWPEGTLCVTIAANIAETAVLGIDACFPDSVIGLVPNPDLVETDFLEYLLTHFRGVMVAQGKGSAQANINLATFERLLFPVPTLNEQREIVSRFEEFTTEVDELRSVLESKQSLLTTLRQSLLHQAFTGQL